MSKETSFFYGKDKIVCIKRDKTLSGVGVATYRENEIEQHPIKLVGESVAFLKAERSLTKQKLKIKKQEVALLEKFHDYLFPAKFDSHADWLSKRSEKRIQQYYKEIHLMEKEISDIDTEIKEYLNERKKFLLKVAKHREKRNNS